MPDAKLPEVNAMSVFYSRYGVTERIGLAAGVGAVQARANIRLRRLRDLAEPAEIAADPSWSENLERMTPEYIAPREIDTAWAEVIFLSPPVTEIKDKINDDLNGELTLREMSAYLASLKNMHGKIAAIVSPSEALCAAAAMAGFTVVPAPEGTVEDAANTTAFAKRVCEMARKLKG